LRGSAGLRFGCCLEVLAVHVSSDRLASSEHFDINIELIKMRYKRLS
jgi:hypothetical protein